MFVNRNDKNVVIVSCLASKPLLSEGAILCACVMLCINGILSDLVCVSVCAVSCTLKCVYGTMLMPFLHSARSGFSVYGSFENTKLGVHAFFDCFILPSMQHVNRWCLIAV